MNKKQQEKFNEWLTEVGKNQFTYKQVYTNEELLEICEMYCSVKMEGLRPELEQFFVKAYEMGWHKIGEVMGEMVGTFQEPLNPYLTKSKKETEIFLNKIK